MAQTKRTGSSGKRTSTGRSTSSGKRSSSSSSRSGSSSKPKTKTTQAPRKEEVEVGFGDYWHAFSKTKAFVPVISVLVTLLLIGLDLLISWNGYRMFFLLVGIELLAAAVGRLIYMIYTMGKNKADSMVSAGDDNEVL
ncbi:hypothetical protein SAMN02910456_00202 [Ruminococcaceae bacterium YRB3002]|nr:hypothetical protein SAMN02910456_00202 [Ruminococcaceae bacterium YRB3002]